MPIAQRRADVVWRGTLEQGDGSFTVGDWVVGEVPVTWESRTREPRGNTSPEELLAASHASCYAMALSQVLDQDSTPPERLEVAATCTLDKVGEGFGITTMDLDVRGRVTGLDDEGLQSAADRAHEICPISNALRGNVEIRVSASRQEDQFLPD